MPFIIVGLIGCGERGDGGEVAAGGKSDGEVVQSESLPKSLGSATLNWFPPTTKTDGNPLTDLAGYNVYWGRGTSSFDDVARIDNAGITVYVIDGLNPGTWRFAVTAFDSNGIESPFSNMASKFIPE